MDARGGDRPFWNWGVTADSTSPALGATFGARTLNDEGPGGTGDSTAAFASGGWELDVWGKLRAQKASAEAAYEATASRRWLQQPFKKQIDLPSGSF